MLTSGEITSLYIEEHEPFHHFNIIERFWGKLLSAPNWSKNFRIISDYRVNLTDHGKTEYD